MSGQSDTDTSSQQNTTLTRADIHAPCKWKTNIHQNVIFCATQI